jgi:DNA-binding response OmpR family regulator
MSAHVEPSAGPVPLVLVADDEHHIRAIIAAKLRSAGMEVVEARDGEEALALARERTPAVVVTDLQMPGMSGLEFCLRMKAEAATSRVPAIMLTARGHILEDGVVGRTNIREVMSKPFGARELVRRVEAVLRERAAGTPQGMEPPQTRNAA